MNIKPEIKIPAKKAFILLLVIFVMYACGGAGGAGSGGGSPIPADAGFATSIIDNTGSTGWYSSIAAGDTIHISYYDYTNGNLKYISNTSGSWSTPITIEYIGKNQIWYTTITSITLDSAGNIHVVYYDNDASRLSYATCLSTDDCTDILKWSTAIVDNSNDGTDVSIAADSLDVLHISYHDNTNNNLRYATCSSICTNSANWANYLVDDTDDTGEYSSIAADSGDLHISYYSSTLESLKYAVCLSGFDCTVTGNWQKGTVDGGKVGINSSIAVDSGTVHISYYDWTNGNLKYGICSSSCDQLGNWGVSIIDNSADAGEYSSIALDSLGKVHISYYDDTNTNLKYATNVSGSWGTYTADSSGSVGEFSSISIDTDDTIHISYFDATNTSLKYAVK